MGAQGQSFGAAAEAYEAGRPDYPAAAVAWLLAGVRGRVLDLGAGSGKLSRGITALGLDVIAVDPDARMLAHNTAGEARLGTAEAIPLADHSVAAATVGQAWHWFDHRAVAAELVRVLQPGGRLALVWNDYDVTDPFTAAFHDVIEPSSHPSAAAEQPSAVAGFDPFSEWVHPWRTRLTASRLEALVRSRSPFLIADPAAQQRTMAAVHDLLRERAGAGPDAAVELAYRSYCYRADQR
jgi:Methylase involved in ubiquinone/menaquinone biosynthesis